MARRSHAERGTYALILWLPTSRRIRVGALGPFFFHQGWYIYVGSGRNGLKARIARHLRQDKTLFWHIDYFLQHARVLEVWLDVSGKRRECRWAQHLLRQANARVIAPKMGASDCSCATHLIYLEGRPRKRR